MVFTESKQNLPKKTKKNIREKAVAEFKLLLGITSWLSFRHVKRRKPEFFDGDANWGGLWHPHNPVKPVTAQASDFT